jgi:hypothetical protein
MPLKICCARVPADVAPMRGCDAGLLGAAGAERRALDAGAAADEVAELGALGASPLTDGLRLDAGAVPDARALPDDNRTGGGAKCGAHGLLVVTP